MCKHECLKAAGIHRLEHCTLAAGVLPVAQSDGNACKDDTRCSRAGGGRNTRDADLACRLRHRPDERVPAFQVPELVAASSQSATEFSMVLVLPTPKVRFAVCSRSLAGGRGRKGKVDHLFFRLKLACSSKLIDFFL